MAAIVSSRTVLRETIGARLRRVAAAGPGSAAAMPTGAPALSSTTTLPAALTQSKPVASSALPAGIRTYGGKVVFPYADTAKFPASWEGTGGTGNSGGIADGAPNGEYSNLGFAVEFETDAPLFAVSVQSITTLGWRVTVDGVYAQLAPVAMVANGVNLCVVDFTGTATPRQRRLIRYEGSKAGTFRGLYLGAQDRIYEAPPVDSLTMLVVTDSYGDYTSGTAGVAAPASLFHHAARRLGIADLRLAAIGGTGWKAGTATTTGRGRLPGVQTANPSADLIVTALGTNDTDTAANIGAEVALYLADVRVRWPNAIHFVLGPWPKNTGPSAALIAYDAAIGTAVAAFGDARTMFIPVSPSVAEAWTAGTGYNGSNATDRSSLAQGPDANHLNDLGKTDFGNRLAAAIRSRLSPVV